jgi:PAS domain S-box-containing protein
LLVPLLLAGAVVSLWQLSRTAESVEHTHQVELSLAAILSTLVDAETGVRGYAITGEREFLEPYDRALERWPGEFSRLRALTANSPAQQERLARLEQLTEERLGSIGELRSEYDAGRRGTELTTSVRAAKGRMDTLRGLVAELQQEEARLDGARRRDAVRLWQTTLLLFVGGTFAFVGAIVVTQRRRSRAEAELRGAEEHFRLMVESVRDYAIITLDREGRVTSWNRGAQAIKGYRSDEIIGQHFSRFYLPEEAKSGKCERELETVAREGRFEEEGWRVRKDGSRFWANVVINAVKDERDQLVGFTKVTRDLTERKQATEALADETRRRTAAEQETRFAQMFVGILGHDLRNPLNAVMISARLAKKKMGAADSTLIDRITASGQRMSNMVDQLLDLTRSRLAGGIPVTKKAVDLSVVISGVVEELRAVHPERQIRWAPSHPGDTRCAADPDRMAQVASNLIGNAIQHSDPSTPITVSLTTDGSEIALRVHNLGRPIPAELLPHIFEPYRRTTVRSQLSKGLGLGLFIAEQVVRAHGGRIDVCSTVEEGTTFTIELPCARPTEVAATAPVE